MWRLATSLSQNGWLIYLLGLAAIGLLPVRKRLADLGVSLILAFLWGLLAFRSKGEPFWAFWVALAVLQAGLFLVIGVIDAIRGRLRFTTRNGAWAIVGTCLIVYCLFVFPLLAYSLPEIFGSSSRQAPLPLLLFTCGILFFAAEKTTNLALVPPLLWALFSGPHPNDLVEVRGLQVALLVSIYFLLLPPELRGGSGRLSPGASYKFAYQRRWRFGYGLWTIVLTSVFLTFLALTLSWTGRLRLLTINFALLSLLGIALWLSFPAWQSLWFRYSAWWLARITGRIWVWLQGGWRWGVFLLAAAVLFLIWPVNKDDANGGHAGEKPTISQPTKGSRDNAGKQQEVAKAAAPVSGRTGKSIPGYAIDTLLGEINHWVRDIPLGLLVVTVLLWLSTQAYRARKRLVIGAFADYTSGEKAEKWVQGLGARLQNELARIADLFKVIDETYPSPKTRVIEVTPNVQDVGEVLKDASAITWGSLKIGSNLLAGIVSSIVSGRRLTGALHKVGKEYVLTAELSGGGQARSWRVDFRNLTEEQQRLEGEAAVDVLVEQLALRVATHLVSIGSPRWHAVHCYTNGLRAQREAQRRQADKNAQLREAERSFIEALNDDQRFTLCHYNLGVVYQQLEEQGSAESAFRCALKEDPSNFDACYGLAFTAACSSKPRDAVWFCKAAIEIDSADPRPWDLEAYALRQDEETREGSERPLAPHHPAWQEILERSEIAGALAWRALCHQLLRGSSTALPATEPTTEQTTAYLCVRNLAVVLTRSGCPGCQERSEQIFRQAAWIAPHDPNPRLYEARTLFWNQKDSAPAALEGVFDDGLEGIEDRGLLWSMSAQVHAPAVDGESGRHARLAVRRFLDLAATTEDEELENLLKVSLEEPPEQPGEVSR